MTKGFDKEFYECLLTQYCIQDPGDKGKFHTILTFYLEGNAVYLELTPQSGKTWYGKEIIFDREQSFVNEYKKNDCDVIDVTDAVIIG